MNAIVAIGIDAGSSTTKVAGIDASGVLIYETLEPTSPRMEEQLEHMCASARARAAPDAPLVATGYGRKLVRSADRAVTEITCHAMGVFRALHQAGTVIDIGGQDTKVIVVDDTGAVVHFGMNDRCAAGTGRFLDVMARRLGFPLDEGAAFSTIALQSTDEEAISSTCTVFAESEVISLLAANRPVPAIVRGLHRALASRVASLARSVGVKPPVLLSGGVARSEAIRVLLGEALQTEIVVPPHPQQMGAYGAALIALRGHKPAHPSGAVVETAGCKQCPP